MQSLYDKILSHITQAQLAAMLQISPSAISQWQENGVPEDRAVDIERATEGKVRRQEVAPRFYE